MPCCGQRPRIAAALTSPTELPEGTVTILFTDVVGSTELTNRVGDGEARRLMGACDDRVRELATQHRGVEVKGTGDGLTLAFQSARRAVTCAIDRDGVAAADMPSPRGVRGARGGDAFLEYEDVVDALAADGARSLDDGVGLLGAEGRHNGDNARSTAQISRVGGRKRCTRRAMAAERV